MLETGIIIGLRQVFKEVIIAYQTLVSAGIFGSSSRDNLFLIRQRNIISALFHSPYSAKGLIHFQFQPDGRHQQ